MFLYFICYPWLLYYFLPCILQIKFWSLNWQVSITKRLLSLYSFPPCIPNTYQAIGHQLLWVLVWPPITVSNWPLLCLYVWPSYKMVRFNMASTTFYSTHAPVPKLYLTHCLLNQSMKLVFLYETIEIKRKREAEGKFALFQFITQTSLWDRSYYNYLTDRKLRFS